MFYCFTKLHTCILFLPTILHFYINWMLFVKLRLIKLQWLKLLRSGCRDFQADKIMVVGTIAEMSPTCGFSCFLCLLQCGRVVPLFYGVRSACLAVVSCIIIQLHAPAFFNTFFVTLYSPHYARNYLYCNLSVCLFLWLFAAHFCYVPIHYC